MNLLNPYFSNKKKVPLPVTETSPFIVVGKIGVLGVHRGSYNFRQTTPNVHRFIYIGQVRVLLDKRVGDVATFAFTTGAVRSA